MLRFWGFFIYHAHFLAPETPPNFQVSHTTQTSALVEWTALSTADWNSNPELGDYLIEYWYSASTETFSITVNYGIAENRLIKYVYSHRFFSLSPHTVVSLAAIDWNCLLSQLLHLPMPIKNSQTNPFRTAIILIQVKDLDSFICDHKSWMSSWAELLMIYGVKNWGYYFYQNTWTCLDYRFLEPIFYGMYRYMYAGKFKLLVNENV